MQLLPMNHTRRRGVILSPKGSRKLNQAKATAEIEHNFKRYTLEALSEETGLTPTTLSKVFTGSGAVDKRTLECCFNAFNLTLLTDDYLYLKLDRANLGRISSMLSAENCSDLESASCDFSLETPYDSPLETLSDRKNIPETHKMDRLQDELQTRPPTTPGGQMPLNSVFYIDRPILESLCYEAIQQPGALITIRAPKQMGKTSLMTRVLVRARSLGYRTVSVSLQLADAEILQNLERFLKWLCARVSKQLGLSNAIAESVPPAIVNFWDNSLGSKANITNYFEDIFLSNCDLAASLRENRSLVMAIDELNQLFAYPDIASEFLLLLRTWSEQAKAGIADSNTWHKLRLVTAHSTEILMPSTIDPSFLNTGLAIELPEFTQTQVQDLADRFGQEITKLQIEQLIVLLGGHPYRLQLAFYYLQQQTITLEELLGNSEIALAIFAEHLQQQWWNLQRYPDLWTVFTQIVKQSSPINCEVEQGHQLHQMGLIYLQGGQASLACELFRPFFCDRLLQ
jgi:transcriptional regulator with XRE-family HTH domain